jgi:poly(hydroxyalkanoate) depolymerase family esterase
LGFSTEEELLSLAEHIDFLSRLPKPGDSRIDRSGSRSDPANGLVEMRGFGSNPGNLRMFACVPARLQRPRALVVVLHGCAQSAASYDLGSGWSTLAKHYGFAVMLPQQEPVNNASGCFNWSKPDDIARGRGEACSIRQMVARMVHDHGIDSRCVFVTGMSAGGAMASVMLATYPEVFAGGAIIAGLPFGIATNLREAMNAMHYPPLRPAAVLGDLVRNASRHRGAFPKVSVWHGSADRIVNPTNAGEIVKQWLDVHHLPDVPMSECIVDGYPRKVWWNTDGDTLVESYEITDMGHGTPLGRAEDERSYGEPGGYMLDAGISSSHHIAKFFRLTHSIPVSRPARPASPSTKLIPAVCWIAAPKAQAEAEPSRVAELPSVVAALVEVPPPPVPLHSKLQAPWPLPREPTEARPNVSTQRPHRILGRVRHAIVRKLVAARLMK